MSLVFSASPTVRFATPSWSAVYAIGPGGRDREVAGQAAKTSTGVSSAGLKSSSESPKSRRVGRQKNGKIAAAVPPIKWATAAALGVGNKTGPRFPAGVQQPHSESLVVVGSGAFICLTAPWNWRQSWHTAFGV